MNSEHRFDVVVVGGGPAGIAAAVCAAESGLRVGVVDDNPAAGGQIWRREPAKPSGGQATKWLQRLGEARVQFLAGASVIEQPENRVLRAETFQGIHSLAFDKLILATGARERFLPFPGWTLPNVMGRGGLQALVKAGLPIAKKRVIVAGSGPLLLAVAAYLKKRGARVSLIAEQAPWSRLLRFGAGLWRHPGKLFQAISLKGQLSGVRFVTSCWPAAAQGDGQLENVTLHTQGSSWAEACDYLACGFGLVPNLELPSLLGCKIENNVVTVDDWQQTSIPHIYCAGELTGIGGVELSLVEGQIAGYAAAGRTGEVQGHFKQRRKLKEFSESLDQAFALRDELKSLASPDTMVCRCEDVPLKSLQGRHSWREAKLQTRCGMGPCQGRICGAATQFLLGWNVESMRPPLFPARVSSLASGVSGPTC
ncbi:MAG TPA: FAD/NAD(P)-binding oxidoreductase [Terriglobia bacterium]|nr:FAD/NAD(P)-binding oxidoreductase [Terriglobia bacterium]